MRDRRNGPALLFALLLVAAALPSAGCGGSPASLELIAVAQRALNEASDAEKAHLAETRRQTGAAQAALDAAFDADVHLAEAGRIGPASQPVKLSAEWVISARKGYAAARDALAEQTRQAEAASAIRLDNLTAGGEALDMAGHLIVLQSSLSARMQETLLSLQRRLSNGR